MAEVDVDAQVRAQHSTSDASRSWVCVLRRVLQLASSADEGRVPF